MSKRLTPYQRFLRDSEERRRIILEMRDTGIRQRVIARKFGISDQRVSQIVKAAKEDEDPLPEAS